MRINTKIIIETTNPPIQLLSHDTNRDLENADIQVEKPDMRKNLKKKISCDKYLY